MTSSHVFDRSGCRFLLMLLACVLVFESATMTSFCRGQGVLLPEDNSWRVPRHRPDRPENVYRIRELTVDASINEQIATTQVTQVFENTSHRQIEASFVFPIPYDGAVSEMTFLVDGKEYEAKLLAADEARRIYEGYVRRNQDPALLEWVGQGMFKTSVFPIPAGATRTVTLKYSQLLRKQSRLTDYLFPLASARYTCRPLEKLSVRVSMQSKEKIGNIYSPTHLVDIKRDDEFNAVVTHTSASTIPSTDFRLVFDTMKEKLGVSVMSFWPKDADAGYFIVLASPELKPSEGEPVKKTVLFVVDQSGSMSGPKIEQARDAAKFVLNNLRENDLFNLIGYDSEIHKMLPELQRYNSDTRQSSIGFINSINAGGMTNIEGALKSALEMIHTEEVPSYVVFLTDGLPTVGETNELRLAKAALAANKYGARLISFGVGYDVNSRLLDRLSRENNGQSEYVRPDEDLEASVARLYSKISSPVLSKIQMNYNFEGLNPAEGKPVDRLYPEKVTDMYAGGQIVIVGRYRKAGPMSIDISGKVNLKEEKFQFTADLASQSDSTDLKFVAQLWASRRIGEIIDLIDLNGKNAELINELVELSKKWGIVTPYTSYLADDQGGVAGLSRRGALHELTSRSLDSFEAESGEEAFSSRAQKQLYKKSDLATPQANQALAKSRGLGFALDGPRGQKGMAGFGGGGRGALAGELAGNNSLSGIRQVGTVTIYVRGNTLVAENAADVELENNSSIVDLKRFSDKYFELVSANTAEENLILSEQQEGETLVVKLRGSVYRIN